MIDGGFDKDRFGQFYFFWFFKVILINMIVGDEEEGLERNLGFCICVCY